MCREQHERTRMPVQPSGGRSGLRALRVAALLASVALACDARTARSPRGDVQSSTAARRTVTAAEWSIRWARGGEDEDSLLLMPSQLVADSAHVYVLDPGGPRVVAFRAYDGTVAWTFERRGAGPGELRAPTAIARSGAGELLVLDEANQRVTVLGGDGRFARSIPLRAGFGFESLCARGGGEVLLKRSGHRGGLVRIAADGAPIAEADLPWPAGDAAWSAQWHGRLAGSGDGCVLALSLGLGFVVHDAAGLRAPVAYVEPFALPAVEITQQRQGSQLTVSQRIVGERSAAIDAAVADGRLHVLFGGESSLAYRIVDVYRLPGGAYERSHSFRAGIERIAVAGQMLYALVREGDVPRLVAFRTAPPGADPVQPAQGTEGGRR